MSLSADDGETVDVYEKTQQRSRKQRDCDACELPILPGHGYVRESTLYDGRWEHVVRCARCDLIWEHLQARMPSGEFADRQLNCGHEYEERWGEKPPEWLAALAFWMPGDPLPATRPCIRLWDLRYYVPAHLQAHVCTDQVWARAWSASSVAAVGSCTRTERSHDWRRGIFRDVPVKGDPSCTAVCS